MLLMRKEQIEVLKRAAREQSARDITATLCEDYPIHCQVAGRPAMRSLVGESIERAAALGLDKMGEVQTYAELSLMLGHDFENDPQIPWAGDTLNKQDEIPAVDKLEQVYARTLDYLNQVAGADGGHLDQALNTLHKTPQEKLVPPPSPDFVERLVEILTREWPHKANALGEKALAALVERAGQQARGMGMATPDGHGLCAWLMFLLGSGFADDPLFPWVARVMADAPAAHREHQLAHEAKAYLGRWLQALKQEGA
jgi:hypothetical protein